MTQEEKAKRYDETLEQLKGLIEGTREDKCAIMEEDIIDIFPELKESEDERIKKKLITYFQDLKGGWFGDISHDNIIAWLEKQGDTSETIDRDKFAQGVLRGAAINLITWIDYNAAEGNMCLSNVQCKEIENALVRGDWNKIYAYMKKKLEKQDEQKSIFDFNAHNWYVSKVDGKIHNIYNSGVEPKFHESKKIEEEYDGEDYGIDGLWHAQRILEKTLGKVDGYQTDDGILEHKCAISSVKKLYEQPSAWSEDDEHRLKDTIYFLDTAKKHYASIVELDACIDWLKSLKKRLVE